MARFFAIDGPSGSGKTSAVRAVVDRVPNLVRSVSQTTRMPRPGEVHGNDYWFVSNDDFFRRVDAQGFLEHAFVHNAWYGTGRPFTEGSLAEGKDVMSEVNWGGIVQLREHGIAVTSIYILPPSMDELERRLRTRGGLTDEQIANRMRNARIEMATSALYDYVITNGVLATTVDTLASIVTNSRLTRHAP